VKGTRPATLVWGASRQRGRRGEELPHGPRRAAAAGVTLTIADGLRTPLAPRTLAAIRTNVDAVETCSEERSSARCACCGSARSRRRGVRRRAARVPARGAFPAQGKRIGIDLSGGNVDLDKLPWQ
jgi:threonine dehydratase